MSAVDLIQTYLRTTEARDLEAAGAMLAEGAAIVFPGGRVYATLGEMVANARGRYQWVKKTFDTIDHYTREDGTEVVYAMGTLYGVNNHDVPFEGVRYIDRFEVRGGKIHAQYVWNDLAESGVLQRQSESEAL